jgi:hypothetical protein
LLNVRFPALAKRRGSSAVGVPLPDAVGLERAKAVAVLLEAVNKRGQDAQVSAGGRGNKGGISEVARDLGVSCRTVGRNLRIAGLTPEAVSAAIDEGVSRSSFILERAAREPGADAQVAEVRRRFAGRLATRKFCRTMGMRPYDDEMHTRARAFATAMHDEYGHRAGAVFRAACDVIEIAAEHNVAHSLTIPRCMKMLADEIDDINDDDDDC